MRRSLSVIAVAALLSVQCMNPVEFSQEREIEYCWWVLSAYFIFQQRLPDRPRDYSTPAALFESVDDPYTVYIDPDEAALFQQSLTTRQGGIGIAVDSVAGGYVIRDVFHHSPGERAGLQEGDTIVAAEGRTLAGVSSDDISSYLGGRIGQQRTLRIARGEKELTITVILGSYYAPTVTIDSLNDTLAYILLTRFADSTELPGGSAEEFRIALQQTAWARHTILDLRQNGGGTLTQCVRISSEFVPVGASIIRSKERYAISAWESATRDTVLKAVEGQRALDRPFTVLVDNYTASASEAFVSCLHENRGSDIETIGQRTFGKGSGWYSIGTPRGGIANVTGMLLIPVNNESYNLKGIEPDVSIDENQDALEIAQALLSDPTAPAKRLAAGSRTAAINALRKQYLPEVWRPVLIIDRP